MLLGILVFALTYLLIALPPMRLLPIDRPTGALIGAVLAVAVGALTPDQAAAAVDHSTLVLLFAVMGTGAFLSLDGFFDRIAPRLATRARTPKALLGALVWGAGLLAPFITNDAVCVIGAPVVIGWIRRWKLPRLPFLLALATAANTGSVATLIGNPQNMLCSNLGHLSFRAHLVHLVPVAVVGLFINHALLRWMFRKELAGELPEEAVTGRLLTWRSALTLTVIVATVVVYTLGANLTFTALGGFVPLLLLHRAEPARVWERIDWSVLLFFGALFVAVDAFARSGATAWVFGHAPLFTGHQSLASYLRTSAYFLAGSNAVSNVPFILLARDHVSAMPDAQLGWELLAMASTFGGNLTLLGSAANVIVADKARSDGGLGFLEYLRVGLPLAILTTAVGTVWLVLGP